MKYVEIKSSFNISEKDFKTPAFQKVMKEAKNFAEDIQEAADGRPEFNLHNIKSSVTVK